MHIAIHDADGHRFPNLALMKLSAWHKAHGDSVEFYQPLLSHTYDKIYSSKVFTFTKEDPMLAKDAIKGGTGYGMTNGLPDEIEHMCPDYELYHSTFSQGFLTRGCIRHCPWCIVPKKEGMIHAHADITEFLRHRDVVLMDNNVLAHPHGIAQIEKIAGLRWNGKRIRVDFNQGLDARLIDSAIAKRLAALQWLQPARLACDQKSQMPAVEKAVRLMRAAGVKPVQYFCYVLVKDVEDALERVEFLRSLNVAPFAQPYRNFETNEEPPDELKWFANWVNRKAIFNSCSWEEFDHRRMNRTHGKRLAKKMTGKKGGSLWK